MPGPSILYNAENYGRISNIGTYADPSVFGAVSFGKRRRAARREETELAVDRAPRLGSSGQPINVRLSRSHGMTDQTPSHVTKSGSNPPCLAGRSAYAFAQSGLPQIPCRKNVSSYLCPSQSGFQPIVESRSLVGH